MKKTFVLLLGGCFATIAGESTTARPLPSATADEAKYSIVEHRENPMVVSGKSAPRQAVQPKHLQRASLQSYQILRVAGQRTLSPSRKSFETIPNRPMRQFSAYGVLFRDMLQNRELGRQAALTLLEKENSIPAHTLWPAFWAALYLDSLPGNAAASRETALALAFVGKWSEAGEIAQQLLADSPGDFGLNLFLGLLSPQKKEFFKYLEQAAAINLVKTAMAFNWCLAHWPMKVKADQEWDFADAWLRLILKHRDRLKGVTSDFKPVAETLQSAILEKYFTGTDIRPEYRELESELRELQKILNKICRRKLIPAEPSNKNSIHVKQDSAKIVQIKVKIMGE